MPAIDIIHCGGLFAFAVLLSFPPFAGRKPALWLAAGAALAAGVWSAIHFNWQAAPGAALALVLLLGLALAALLRRTTGNAARPRPFLGAAILLVSLLAAAPFYFFPPVSLPEPGGPFPVGTAWFDLTDEARRGVLEDAADAPRRIQVRVWYPAGDVSGLALRPYLTNWEAKVQAPSVARNWTLPPFALSHLRNAKVHGFENAPIAGADETYPVIVYSHGYWGWAGQNTALMEHLASRGYIIFSIGHPYDAGAIRFGDGDVIGTSPLMEESQAPDPAMTAFWAAKTHDERLAAFPAYREAFDRYRIMKSHAAWMADTQFLIEALRNEPAPEGARALAARADMERLGIGGMSFGGQIAASVCHREPACKAALNFDGGAFDWELIDAPIRMPLLMMHSDWVGYAPEGSTPDPDFNLNDYAYEPFERAGQTGKVFRVRVKGIRHLGFTDLVLIARRPVRDIGFGAIEPTEATAVMNDFAAGFFDRYVKAEDNGFPESTFARHPDAVPHTAKSVREWRLRNQPGQAFDG